MGMARAGEAAGKGCLGGEGLAPHLVLHAGIHKRFVSVFTCSLPRRTVREESSHTDHWQHCLLRLTGPYVLSDRSARKPSLPSLPLQRLLQRNLEKLFGIIFTVIPQGSLRRAKALRSRRFSSGAFQREFVEEVRNGGRGASYSLFPVNQT